jgi:ASC-1-like (ASCH) protein
MNGIYLTQEGKKEIEDRIVELENTQSITEDTLIWNKCVNEKNLLKEILLVAKILPVEKSWENIAESAREMSLENLLISNFENGVIIKSNWRKGL